jgi:hypothetical protein
MGCKGAVWLKRRIWCVVVGCKTWCKNSPTRYWSWGGRENVGTQLLVVIVTLLENHLAEVWLAGSSGSLSAKGANGLLLHVTQ